MKYFKESEFNCNCGECNKGFNDINVRLKLNLELARAASGVSYSLSSAMRCATHNKNERGKSDSSHLRGLAVDIKVSNSYNRFRILSGLIKAGFNRIGIAKTFIHADVDLDKDPEVIWLY